MRKYHLSHSHDLPSLPQGHIGCPAHSAVWRYLRRWSTLVFSICLTGSHGDVAVFGPRGFLGLVALWRLCSSKPVCQIFLQWWVYVGSAENCDLGSATIKSPAKMERPPLCRGKGSGEGYSKQRVLGSSLAASLPGKRSLSSSWWALLGSQSMRVPPSGLLTILIEVSAY